MDKDALGVIEAAFLGDEMTDHVILPSLAASVALAALGANGYVVVPRRELEELTRATGFYMMATKKPACGFDMRLDKDAAYERLVAARAAVVEAVGPTREDTKRECICPPATFTTVEEHGYASASSSTRYGCPKHTYEARNEVVEPTT